MAKRRSDDAVDRILAGARGEKKPAETFTASSTRQLSEAQEAFRSRMAKEDKRFKKKTDSEFWLCMVFASRDSKEAFLRGLGLMAEGDKFLDGHAVAKALNIELPDDT